MVNVFGNAVGRRALHVVPHEFIRVKLRGVPREGIGVDRRVFCEERFDSPRLVDGASIPEKNETSLQMLKENLEESPDLGVPDILRNVKPDVKIDPPSSGRNTDSRDRGDFRPRSGHLKNRRLTTRRPSPLYRWNKGESALIEEDEWDFKPFGLFLYVAIDNASTVLSSAHPALGLVFQAFGNSNPSFSKATRYYWGDKKRPAVYQSPWQFSESSKDLSSNRSLRLPKVEFLSESVSGARLASQVAPTQVLASRRCPLFFFADYPSNKLNLTNTQSFGQHPANLNLYPVAPRLADGAVQAVLGFHEVS